METVSFDMHSLTPHDQYLLLRDTVMPRPIAWVSSQDPAGRTNLAPFSFFNVLSADPPILGFSVGPAGDNFGPENDGQKDTLANIMSTKEFVINIVAENLLDQMVRTSDPLPPGEDEFAHAGLTPLPSTLTGPPRVKGAPVAFECKLHEVLRLGTHHLVMGEIIYAHIMEEVYAGSERGTHRVNLLKRPEMRPPGRLDRANYTLLREVAVRLRAGN